MKLGDRGCQCNKCLSHDIGYQVGEGEDWYECEKCGETGDKYDFTCISVPDEDTSEQNKET